MIDATQAQQALAQPLGISNPLGARRNGCIGAGDAGFFCKYVTDYLAEAGLPMTQILRGGYTVKTTLDRNVMEKMKASLNAEVPADAANVADVMAIVAPGQDHHAGGVDGAAALDARDDPPVRDGDVPYRAGYLIGGIVDLPARDPQHRSYADSGVLFDAGVQGGLAAAT